MHTIKSLAAVFNQVLSSMYDAPEAKAIGNLVFMHALDWDKSDLFLNADEALTPNDEKVLLAYLKDLQTGKPVQYVLGEIDFFDLKFKVNSDVLIPRPETEELVRWILKDEPQEELKVLDIGTGSGIIPISLKHAREQWEVHAIDLSEPALRMAEENAQLNLVDVQFSAFDVLSEQRLEHSFDIIVSNPPYIPINDKKSLHQNVKDFEPHLALFVPNDDATIFYTKIADLALGALNKPGFLYFEIYELYAQNIIEMLHSKGFQAIELRQDMAGKDRMIRAKLA